MKEALAKQYQNLQYKREIVNNLSYYAIKIDYKKLFESENCNEECYNFIEQHFHCGEKMTAISEILSTNEDKEKLRDSIRSVHMVSLYLLGYSLYEKFDKDLEKYFSKYIKELKEITSWYDFRYTWFLMALYHDISSCKEEVDISNEIESEEVFEKVLNNEKNIYNYKLQTGKKFIPKFSKEDILNYLKQRKKENRIDHGIVAGYEFFCSICMEFERKLGEKKCVFESRDNQHKLRWDRTHMDHFVFIADAIISHNIWFNALKDKKIEKWDYDRYPLNFILCLLDTIEPLKRFCGEEETELKYNDVLENISIVQNGKRSIKISWNDIDIIKKNKGYQKWINDIKGLDQWMNVEVMNTNKQNSIILTW